MGVQYRHNYIELYSLSGGQIRIDPAYRGITINNEHPEEYKINRDFTLYQFSPNGKLLSTGRYDLYSDVMYGTSNESNRMVADLSAMPVGQMFAIVTYDEPSQGHALKANGVPNVELVNAMVGVGASRELYSRPWRTWCAYMLVGKVGSAAYYEMLDESPRPDMGEVYGNGVVYQAFTIINGEFLTYKYQNKISTRVSTLWKECQAIYYKQLGKWKRVRRIYVKVNGVWKKTYVRNHFEAYSMGLRQDRISHTLRGLVVNNMAVNPSGRSYNIYMFNDDGTFLTNKQYDIFGDDGNFTNTNRMIADLNAMPRGQPFVIVTYDEPQLGHLRPGLPEAMYRIGATPEIFGGPMGYRGAYMLAGNAESKPVLEYYIGDNINPGDANTGGALDAVIYFSFTVHEGVIIQIPDKAV